MEPYLVEPSENVLGILFYFVRRYGTVERQTKKKKKKKAEANVKIQKTCDSWKEKERDLNPPIRIVSFHPLKKKKKKNLIHVVYYL